MSFTHTCNCSRAHILHEPRGLNMAQWTLRMQLLYSEFKQSNNVNISFIPCLRKRSIFVFVKNFDKFPPILTTFGRKMVKWLKLYATYIFSTSHNLCHRTTLLNTLLHNTGIYYNGLRVRHPSVKRPPTDLLNVDLVWRSQFSLTFFLVSGRVSKRSFCELVGVATVNSFSSVIKHEVHREVRILVQKLPSLSHSRLFVSYC